VIIVAYKKVASSLVKLLVSTSEVYNVSPEIIAPRPSIGLCGTFGVCIDTQDYYSGYVNPPYDYVRVSPFYTMGVLDTPVSGSTPYSELAIDYLTTKDYA